MRTVIDPTDPHPRQRPGGGTDFTGSAKPPTTPTTPQTPPPLAGTPEPYWNGSSRGPESLRWMEWARQNGALRPGQVSNRPPQGPGGSDWLNGTVPQPERPGFRPEMAQVLVDGVPTFTTINSGPSFVPMVGNYPTTKPLTSAEYQEALRIQAEQRQSTKPQSPLPNPNQAFLPTKPTDSNTASAGANTPTAHAPPPARPGSGTDFSGSQSESQSESAPTKLLTFEEKQTAFAKKQKERKEFVNSNKHIIDAAVEWHNRLADLKNAAGEFQWLGQATPGSIASEIFELEINPKAKAFSEILHLNKIQLDNKGKVDNIGRYLIEGYLEPKLLEKHSATLSDIKPQTDSGPWKPGGGERPPQNQLPPIPRPQMRPIIQQQFMPTRPGDVLPFAVNRGQVNTRQAKIPAITSGPLDRLDQITQARDIHGNEIKTADMLVSGGVKLQQNQRANEKPSSGLQFRNVGGEVRVVGSSKPKTASKQPLPMSMGQQQPERPADSKPTTAGMR
jgi:hypothetical protein